MKKNVKNESLSIIQWVKKIFSAQKIGITLTVIFGVVACIGAWYTYKSYKDSRPSQISLKYYDCNKAIDVDEKDFFVSLRSPYERKVIWGNGVASKAQVSYGGYVTRGLPIIENNTHKSIKDLKVDVTIWHGNLHIEPKDICQEYNIIEQDHEYCSIKLRYIYDVLKAHTAIPFPVQMMSLPDSISKSNHKYSVLVTYDITYDGLETPKAIHMIDVIYFDENRDKNIVNLHIDDFLTKCYDTGYFTGQKRRTLVSIIPREGNAQIVCPPRSLSDKNFEQFKQSYMN